MNERGSGLPAAQQFMSVVAIGTYKNHAALPLASSAAAALAGELQRGGYTHALPQLLSGGTSRAVGDAINDWFREASDTDTLVLFWTGHGHRQGNSYYLVTEESPKRGLNQTNAVDADFIGTVIAGSKAEKVLVILDTCFSGDGATDILDSLSGILASDSPIPGRQRAVAVIASAHPLQRAREALFCDVLRSVINGPDNSKRSWTDEDRFIYAQALSDAIADELRNRGETQVTLFKSYGHGWRFVRNPRYRSGLPAEDVETRRSNRIDAQRHFLPASRSIEIGEAGWYFVGRTHLLRTLVSWLKEAKSGLRIVTGPPGAGKSAVMGRLATLSDATYREMAASAQVLAAAPEGTVPPQGIIDIAIHAKGKTLDDCARAVAEMLAVRQPGNMSVDIATLLHDVGALGKRTTIVLDALDEAAAGHAPSIGSLLLLPLSQLPLTRVLIGTRRSPDGAIIPDSEGRHSRLRALFGDDAAIHDLDDEPRTVSDLHAYVRMRLEEARFDPGDMEATAQRVAQAANGAFLYARLVARTLSALGRLDGPLPADALAAFVSDLAKRFGDQRQRVEGILAALAWGEGKGLTRRVWAPVATALTQGGAVYEDEDVAWVLANAGSHVVETGEDGQAVYRLAHQAFADFYRLRWQGREVEAQARIVAVLKGDVTGAAWLDTDPYLWRHLASHAVASRTIDELIPDPGYLAIAAPARLQPAFSAITSHTARRIADVYIRVLDRLLDADSIQRMALIHLTAWQDDPQLAGMLAPPAATQWQCRWAVVDATSPHRLLADAGPGFRGLALFPFEGSPAIVSAGVHGLRSWNIDTGSLVGQSTDQFFSGVAAEIVDGLPVIAYGKDDGSIGLWDARANRPLGKSIRAHEGDVYAVAVGPVHGQLAIVSGGQDGAVRLWDARTLRPIKTFRRARNVSQRTASRAIWSVALGVVKNRPLVIAAGEDGVVLVWDLLAKRHRSLLPAERDMPVKSVAFGLADDLPVIVAGGGGAITTWNAETGKRLAVHRAEVGDYGRVRAVAVGNIDGSAVAVSAGWYNQIDLWNLRSGERLCPPLKGSGLGVASVALGSVNGLPTVITGDDDGAIRMWEVRTRTSTGKLPDSEDRRIFSVAVGVVDGSSLLASIGTDGTVHLWNAQTGQPARDPLFWHGLRMLGHSVVFGSIDGLPVIVAATADSVYRWDARTGNPVGDPLAGPASEIKDIAFGVVDGAPVIASGTADGIIHLLDARSSAVRCPPLEEHRRGIRSVAFGTVDGLPVVVSGSSDRTVCLWNARTGELVGEAMEGHHDAVNSVAFAFAGGAPVIASAGDDGKICIWDARSRRRLKSLGSASSFVWRGDWLTSVAIGSAGGRPIVVSGAQDGTMRAWAVDSGQLLFSLRVDSRINSIVLADDGVIAIGGDRGIHVIDVTLRA